MSQEEPEAIFLKCTWSKIVKMFQIFPEQFCWVATTKFFRCGLGCFGSNNVEFLLWQFRNCFSLFSGPYCWITAHTIFWRRFRVFFATIDFKCSQNKIWKCLTFFPEQYCCFQLRQVLEGYFLSKQQCWSAATKSFCKGLRKTSRQNCRKDAKTFFFWKWLKFLGSNNVQLQIGQSLKCFGKLSKQWGWLASQTVDSF